VGEHPRGSAGLGDDGDVAAPVPHPHERDRPRGAGPRRGGGQEQGRQERGRESAPGTGRRYPEPFRAIVSV
jgi:hypothetical protein